MSNNSWNQSLWTMPVAGPTLTAAAAASMIMTSGTANQTRPTIPAGALKVGDMLRFKASGIISCAVTTPGTARFDWRFGTGTTIVWDSQAISLNIVAQTNVGWYLEVMMAIRSIGAGTAATSWAQGFWLSPAALNVAAPATGPGPGGNILPFNTAPALSGTLSNTTGFDTTIANTFDSFFTQTVATGSMTCEMAELALLT